MKTQVLVFFILLFPVYGQQKASRANYGLYSNFYDFPNYDVSTTAQGYNVNAADFVQTIAGVHLSLHAIGNSSLYGNLIRDLIVDVSFETNERVHVKIYDSEKKQVAVPDSPLGLVRPAKQNGGGQRRGNNNNYQFTYKETPFSFQIKRKRDGATLFDTAGLPFVFEDQYLEVSTHLPINGTNIYGFGEALAPFKRTRNVTTLFARDSHDVYQNMYGSHTFYMDIRKGDGAAHGTFLLNAHGMDIINTEERITYKAIGGILDFYFFVPQDSRPNSVVQAYTTLIGKPTMPAHWMLGYQNCRYNYTSISHVEEVVQKHKDNQIPLEVQWIDIDYMDQRKDFTFDPIQFPREKMIEFSKSLHDNGQKLVLMVDPAIPVDAMYEPYLTGKDMDVFVKNVDGSEYIGQVWPGYTTFPDWWHPNITKYWEKKIIDWMDLLKLDGIWIDMNEPSSFCLGSCGSLNDSAKPNMEPWFNTEEEQLRLHILQESALEVMGQPAEEARNLLYPRYVINNGAGNLSEKTVAMTAQHYGNISHYDVHNLYGHAEGYITRQALLAYNSSTRPFLLSRSTFAGSGSYMGHWTGDIQSTWQDMKGTIADILNFQMFGISFSGADICGFVGDATEELCTRWIELGALYPFSRMHNNDRSTDQEPYIWQSTAEASRIALRIRYSLLPYLYTLFEESNRMGTGVWRPLFFEYPEHIDVFSNNDEQFLIGTDILVSPVLVENAVTVIAQFPPGVWYDWYDYSILRNRSEDNFSVTLDAPLTHIPIHIRGGAIMITKSPKLLVKDTFSTPYDLIIALDEYKQAFGRLYIDDGFSINPERKSNINFIFTGNTLTVNGQFNYHGAESIGKITILTQGDLHFLNATIYGKEFLTTRIKNVLTTMTDGTIFLDQGFSMKFS
ncbi:alpha glucosidase [Mucor mucedo]|uniref:alpha glucosidase n=1 Tax=Mucor mucedo TaxID=29922 RepID=UPI00221F6AE5|nr:alpha glucosidase [Mucor mucedo]KAI7897105.1 alpha glucosidase [Mucor mucedo]